MAAPTRILHITFNMGFGGTEQVIRQLVMNLDKTRFHNEIACIDGEVGALGQAMEIEHGIKHHTRQRAPGFDLQTILWLRKLIKSGRFDIVHCHQYSPYAYGWFAHWFTGAKIVFTEHGRFHPDQYRKKARFVNPLIAHTSHKLVAISSATRDALVEYEYFPRERINVIYNGIAPVAIVEEKRAALEKELGIRSGETIIGTVARMDPVKNQGLILKALRALLDEDFPVRLLLVGDGPERKNLEKLTTDLQVEKSVIFTGFQSQPADYISLMDIFLLPSFTEGTSMTLLEAMSLGIPTVATRVGGTPEIISDGKTGVLTESDNLNEFTIALKLLIEQPATRKQMADRAKQQFGERFSVAKMVEQYQELYQAGTTS